MIITANEAVKLLYLAHIQPLSPATAQAIVDVIQEGALARLDRASRAIVRAVASDHGLTPMQALNTIIKERYQNDES